MRKSTKKFSGFKTQSFKLCSNISKITENDNTLTHFASEKVLAKGWLLHEEDKAWKDL